MGACGCYNKTLEGKNTLENDQINRDQNPKIDLKTGPKIFNDQNKFKEEENEIQIPQIEKIKEETKPKIPIIDIRRRVPQNMVNELLLKYICKIDIKDELGFRKGNGFFIKVNDQSNKDQEKYLIISEQIIPKNNNYEYIELEKFNGQRKMNLYLKDRYIKPLEELNLTVIEIKDTDEICNEIKFLSYNINFISGNNIFKKGSVFSISYSNGEKISSSCGKIIDIENYEFEHDLYEEDCSRGSPIMVYNYNFNEIIVIGIHRGFNQEEYFGYGTFIAKLLSKNCQIQIISKVQNVNISLNCENIDKFSNVEKKLYAKYPYLLKKEINFVSNGNYIDRSRTIIENRIKNGDILMIITEDIPKEVGNICVIILISSDQRVNVIMACKDSDNFSVVEQKLYEEYPKYEKIKNNLLFLANGGVINKAVSLKENNIKNDTTIIISNIEED